MAGATARQQRARTAGEWTDPFETSGVDLALSDHGEAPGGLRFDETGRTTERGLARGGSPRVGPGWRPWRGSPEGRPELQTASSVERGGASRRALPGRRADTGPRVRDPQRSLLFDKIEPCELLRCEGLL